MKDQRFLLETGFGSDQYGQDYTKASIRAVEEAIRRVALPMFANLGIETDAMRVQVTIGVTNPDAVDAAEVAKHLPRGRVDVRVVQGGLDIEQPGGAPIVTTCAAIEAFLPLQGAASS